MKQAVKSGIGPAFGDWLAREIESRLWTRQQFIARTGLSRGHVYAILGGEAAILRGTTLQRIANALHLSREEVESHLDR